MEENEIWTSLLNQRKTSNANKYLFIFPNEQILQFYKRWLKRSDIIYLSSKSSLVGLRYIDWCFINDASMDKRTINNKYPIKKGSEE